MATKTISLNTKPHVLEIGADQYLLQPEVDSDAFVDALTSMQEGLGVEVSELSTVPVSQLPAVIAAVKGFIGELMLPESLEAWSKCRLPLWVLTDALEWTIELYAGGRPTGPSSGSAAASPPGGKSGTARSRSKGSTRARGR